MEEGSTDASTYPLLSPLSHEALLEHSNSNLGEEDDEGSIEYKLKLTKITPTRLKHLVTQMQYRVAEGRGECLYEVGVANDGSAIGVSEQDYNETLKTLQQMSRILNYSLTVLHKKVISARPRRVCGEMLVCRPSIQTSLTTLRVAFCGAVDAGKSTLISVLVEGEPDDGCGTARQSVFRHKHELQTGRTSCLSVHLLGFSLSGRVIHQHEMTSDIRKQFDSSGMRIVALYDLAGSEKYLSTCTVPALSAWEPDIGCVTIDVVRGVQSMTKEQTRLCVNLGFPWFVVLTKIDLVEPYKVLTVLDEIKEFVRLQGSDFDSFIVERVDQLSSIISHESSSGWSRNIIPIIPTSSVTCERFDILHSLLYRSPLLHNWELARKMPLHVTLTKHSFFPDLGSVYHGLVNQGTIKIRDRVMFGPSKNAEFVHAYVRSLHVQSVPVHETHAGAEVTMILDVEYDCHAKGYIPFRPGMVLAFRAPSAGYSFAAQMIILRSNFRIGAEPIIQCRSIRQCALIQTIDWDTQSAPELSEQALVKLRWLYRPEYIAPGFRMTAILCGVAAVGTVVDTE